MHLPETVGQPESSFLSVLSLYRLSRFLWWYLYIAAHVLMLLVSKKIQRYVVVACVYGSHGGLLISRPESCQAKGITVCIV